MKPMNFRQRWVMVTGASSGLGREMARLLAYEHQANLVVVARRADRLSELKDELETQAGVEVVPVAADLSTVEGADHAFEQATQGRELYGAILNAGITHFGPHHELAWEDFERMLSTNVTSVVRLTRLLVPYLEQQNNGGGILLVSSMAGITPVPFQTAYSGTKAFLVHYGCALHHELAGSNVSVTTFIPSGIQTEMTSGKRFAPLRSWLMPVDKCAREAVEGFAARRYLHAPGISHRLQAVAARLLPHRLVSGRVGAAYRSALQKSQ
jgi:hypothetical protein